ncbi:phosphoenolpyruvate--protein phosphotransferase [Pseudomonas sp. GD03842]|uniref:phosphoenolpyruvate--protein phosphotransferase n=1 Tax=Pseudomonas sp. GD03842 TaxID=2975385 RepID=UPI002449983C|nr:phosphoenolpyruvate--protein phosphotransferase [Pseudomonas sp. GD03842]MDH0749704.1 phosphoenolpyruvate--protein phosphotransferase [Pseudomonas sp. GD03842]
MHKNKQMTFSAPFSGAVVSLAHIPDPVFAEGSMGDGLAIDPLDDVLHAPFDGVVINVARTRHAVNLRADNGSEWLLHVGIDTVGLNGEGFQALVEDGQRVRQGQALLRFDLDRVARASRSLISPMILLNGDRFEIAPIKNGTSINVGETLMDIITLAHEPPNAEESGHQAKSAQGRIHVTHRGGLHARPAARVRETARRFNSQSELHFAGAKASTDSVTGLMGLGIAEQDEVEVVCRGDDCQLALQALMQALSAASLEDESHAPATAMAPPNRLPAEPGVITGVCASPGLANGTLFLLDTIELGVDTADHRPEEQRQRLADALAQVRIDISASLDRDPPEQRAIFTTHLAMLEDPALLDAAYDAIDGRQSAAHAWSQAVLTQCTALERLDNPLLAERANDLRDLRQRVLHALLGDTRDMDIPPGAIVVTRELTPSDLLMLVRRGIGGVCMAEGGATSHVVILARGKGLPCVVAMGAGVLEVRAGQEAVLDADGGRLEHQPSEARLREVQAQRLQRLEQRQRQQQHAHQPALTLDGVSIEVAANVASLADAQSAQHNGADGVGLLRTEFLFVERRTAPTEDEQRSAYQSVVNALHDKPVIIRTIDIGGDKQLPYLPLPAEANPVLGLRGIRLGQARPELLDEQLRALLRVTPLARCRILLPMISEVSELLAVRSRIEALADEAGVTERPEVGVMIEVPSAALLADQLAAHADFLSLGTNDLSQYTLAMDRDHAGLAARVDALHPALLRLIGMTCSAAKGKGRWVGVCGALASDPLATAALIGLGVRELSVSPLHVAEIKAQVRELDTRQCEALAQHLMTLGSAEDVREACRTFQTQVQPRAVIA